MNGRWVERVTVFVCNGVWVYRSVGVMECWVRWGADFSHSPFLPLSDFAVVSNEELKEKNQTIEFEKVERKQ